AFDVELGWFRDHPVLALGIAGGACFLVVVVARLFWRWVRKLWEQAKQGGKILQSPKAFVTRVLVPQTISYAAKIGVIAVFLAAYSIPVTFHSVMAVIGSSSAANMTSVTPGAVGVTQAANVVALSAYTDSNTATAYSLAQQLWTTGTNIAFALVLVVIVFGWTGGKQLVGTSYTDAKVKAKEMRTSRKTAHDGDPGNSEPPVDAA
ncbi:MAG: lysylphosphatidylglycerol synthase domain-containing protein, partial [Thermoleophilia bacterium]|nr:lysylphosphatidylglycerol synthase domain-containing protein [Thermoleophilia bacterium]